MKILHIITGLNTGGAERMLVKLIQNTYIKVEHHVISLLDEGTQGEFIKELGVPLDTINMKGVIPSLKNLLKLKKLIKSIKPDVIQGWMYHGNLAASINGFSVPIVYNIRHSLSDIKKEKKTTQWIIALNARLSKKTAKVIYNSNVSREEHEQFNFSKSKSIFLPNGFDVQTFNINQTIKESNRKRFNIDNKAKVFCQIGRNHPMKNHKGFIEAGIEILKEQPHSHFILVGRDVDNNASFQNLIEANKAEKHFTLLGEQDNIAAIWNTADFGVSSSLWGEGFPNVVGEAMACGKPCIVTDVGDSAYVVGDTGVVIVPNSLEALKEAMKKTLLKSDEDIKILSENARERIVNKFSIDEVSRQYLSLYENILNPII